MNKLVLLVLAVLMVCGSAYGQEVDFSLYELVAQRGKISVVTQDGEYRMIVGSLKRPKAALLLGMMPEMAAAQLDHIVAMGTSESYIRQRRSVLFCGETFFFRVSGNGENRCYSFKGLNNAARFSIDEDDIRTLKSAIIEMVN